MQEHQGKSRKGSRSGNIVGQIAPLSQFRRKVDIVIERIPAGMAEIRQDFLETDTFLFMGASGEIPVLVLRIRQIRRTQRRGAQQMIEIFLSGSAAGAVHGMEDLIQIQIIPGDVINSVTVRVMSVILRNLGISLGTGLLFDRPAETLPQGMEELAAGAPSLPHTQQEGDHDKEGD